MLLEGKSWKHWVSLSSELPLLAEAAPDAFLNALQRDLEKPTPAVTKLFEKGGDSVLFGPSYHTGVLWALAYERTRSLLPGMLAHAVSNIQATTIVLATLRF